MVDSWRSFIDNTEYKLKVTVSAHIQGKILPPTLGGKASPEGKDHLSRTRNSWLHPGRLKIGRC